MTMLEQRGSGGGRARGLIKDTTTQTFMKDVIEESKRQPVLVDFWAPWCGPCKQLTPILEKVVKAAKGKVKLVKMNIDEHPAIPGQMGIQSIPAVIAFVNGQPADGFMGALPESQVDGVHRAADQGQGRRRGQGSARTRPTRRWPQGDAAGAAEIYAEMLAEDDGQRRRRSPASRAATSRPARSSRPSRRCAMVPEAKRNDAARRRRARRARARRAGEVGRPDRRAGAEGRGQSARPSGALRSRRRAQRQGQARRRRSIICSRSSSATANGTRTARASSSCSSSRPGVRPTRRRSPAASGCRRSCSA